MAEEKYGIVTLKQLAKAGVSVGVLVPAIFEDKKVSLLEVLGLLTPLGVITEIVKEKKADIRNEWRDRSTAEIAEINAYVASELSLPNNPQLERKIEKGAALILNVIDFADEFKKEGAAGGQ